MACPRFWFVFILRSSQALGQNPLLQWHPVCTSPKLPESVDYRHPLLFPTPIPRSATLIIEQVLFSVIRCEFCFPLPPIQPTFSRNRPSEPRFDTLKKVTSFLIFDAAVISGWLDLPARALPPYTRTLPQSRCRGIVFCANPCVHIGLGRCVFPPSLHVLVSLNAKNLAHFLFSVPKADFDEGSMPGARSSPQAPVY